MKLKLGLPIFLIIFALLSGQAAGGDALVYASQGQQAAPGQGALTTVGQDAPAQVALELVAGNLTAPVVVTAPDDDSGRVFIAEQTGLIWVVSADGERQEEPFLDISDRIVELEEGFEERGLLGLAFHPDYARSGRFFVYYSAPLSQTGPQDWNHTSRVSQFRVSADDPNAADPNSEMIVLEVDQPNPKTNSGSLAFGPLDGYLYIAVGEGGGAHGIGEVQYDALEVPEHLADWDFTAQDLNSLLGKILRIDVENSWSGYRVPSTNPLVGKEGRGEIYAWGFRNVTMSFDQAGEHDLFVSATGEALWETAYIVDQPGNYGWPIKEGTQCFDRLSPLDPPANCAEIGPNGYPIFDPFLEYGNYNIESEDVAIDEDALGTAIVGGVLYRGSAIPELYGKFLFADYSANPMELSGQVLAATPPEVWGDLWEIQQLTQSNLSLRGMGQDAENEVYIATSQQIGPVGDTGAVYKLVPASP